MSIRVTLSILYLTPGRTSGVADSRHEVLAHIGFHLNALYSYFAPFSFSINLNFCNNTFL